MVGVLQVAVCLINGLVAAPHVSADLVAAESLRLLLIGLILTSVGVVRDDEDLAMFCRRRAVGWEGERGVLEAKFLSRSRVRSNLTLGSRVGEPHSDLIRVCCSGVVKSEGDPIRVVAVSECILAESDALGDGLADSIYLGDMIISGSGRAMGHPG